MRQTIPVEAIRACALFAARDMGRYAFHGLSLEHGRLIATDGRRLLTAEWTPAEDDVAPEGSTILPVDVALQAAKVKRCSSVFVNGTMRAKVKRNGHAYAGVLDDGPEFPYVAVEGEFPDWRAVMPKGKDAEPRAESVRLFPGFVEDAGRAAAHAMADADSHVIEWTLSGAKFACSFQVSGPRVKLHGIIMPITRS